MGETFEIGESGYEDIKDFPYDELVKILAILTIIEEEGITPAVWEKWGEVKDNRYTLVFEAKDCAAACRITARNRAFSKSIC